MMSIKAPFAAPFGRKGMEGLQDVLYIFEICDGNNTYTLRGSIYDGELTLNGYDNIPGISHAYGDGEAAYVYNFDRENTQKLTEIFHTENLLESLKKFFGGKKALTEFENLCRENGIYFQAEDINLRLSDRHFVL